MADIYFSSLDRKEVYRLPALPQDMPELTRTAKNEEFESYDNGTYNLLGNVGLATFSLDSWLPEFPGKYKWAKSQINPYLLINLWHGAMVNKKPIRCIMERGKNPNNISEEILNWLVTVESMSWNENTLRDVKYKVDFKEYRDINESLFKEVENDLNQAAKAIEQVVTNIFK